MPPTTHDKPVLRRTVELLREYVRTHALKPGDKLPPVRQLCAETGVSFVTMCKALREVRASGLLTLVNGRSHVVRGGLSVEPQEQKATPVPSKPWQRIADKIAEDVLNGVYRPGSNLSSIKELQRRYRVAYRTVKKSLMHLVGVGSLEQLSGGAFAVPSLVASGWRPRIVCVLGSPDSHAMAFGQNDEALFRALESLCEQARMKIDIYLQFSADDRHQFRHLTTGRLIQTEDLATLAGDSVQGFTYFILWPAGPEDVRTIRALLANKKPVVILDEAASLKLPLEMAKSRNLRTFTTATSQEPARVVAKHLLWLGHRKAAFISVDNKYVWSRLRLQGLTEGFAEAGHPESIRPFVVETPDLREKAVVRSDLPALFEYVNTWKARLPDQYRAEFANALEKLEWEYAARAEQRVVLQPIFEQALADPEITAWVLVNDTTASIAAAFLKDKGVRIPVDLSIISFDDSPIALMNNISSFNFNVQALAASMLGFILNRKPYADHATGERGFIVDRGSTGPAASAGHHSVGSHRGEGIRVT